MSDISIRSVWQLNDHRIEQDAMAFWQRLDQLPAGKRPEDRVKELLSVACSGDQLVGVTTAFFEFHTPLRANLAFYRILLDPDFRGKNLMPLLVQAGLKRLEQWSLDNPAEKLAGLAAVRQSAHLIERFRSPYGRSTGAVMIGIDENGNRISINWFDHYRV